MYVTGSSLNDIKFSNPEYDSLVAASNSEKDPIKWSDLLHQAESFAVIPVYTSYNIGLSNPKITGITYTSTGKAEYPFADIDVG
jgi:ABC-type oligopeptide transport system substrate-binding subunit